MNNSQGDRLLDSKNWLTGKFNDIKNGDIPFGYIGSSIVAIFIILIFLGWYWSQEPDSFDVVEIAQQLAPKTSDKLAIGSVTTATSIHLMETMLDKSGW